MVRPITVQLNHKKYIYHKILFIRKFTNVFIGNRCALRENLSILGKFLSLYTLHVIVLSIMAIRKLETSFINCVLLSHKNKKLKQCTCLFRLKTPRDSLQTLTVFLWMAAQVAEQTFFFREQRDILLMI